jgi:hypothetical protein
MFVIYDCTKLHMPSSTKSLYTAIIKLTARKAVSEILCSVLHPGAKANAAHGLSIGEVSILFMDIWQNSYRGPGYQGLYRKNADIIHHQNWRWTHNTNV